MDTLFIIACAIIISTASGAVTSEDDESIPETTSVSYSNEQTELPSFRDELKSESKIEWKIQLPKNATAKVQQKYFNRLMPFLAKQFDSLRKKRRMDQQYHSNQFNAGKPDQNDDRPFSLEDVMEYFRVGEAQINPETNMATFQISVTDKIYTELDKYNVRDTMWYQKVVEQRNSKWVRE